MRYTDGTGEVRELPKYTRSLAKRIEQVGDEKDRDKRWRLQLSIVQECLGDAADAVLEGHTLDDVDISALESEFEAISMAYEAPKRDKQAERIDSMLSSIDLDRLESVARTLDQLDSRQGFKNVK